MNSELWIYYISRKDGEMGGMLYCDHAGKEKAALSQFQRTFKTEGVLKGTLLVGAKDLNLTEPK